jgi:hypothetical protein
LFEQNRDLDNSDAAFADAEAVEVDIRYAIHPLENKMALINLVRLGNTIVRIKKKKKKKAGLLSVTVIETIPIILVSLHAILYLIYRGTRYQKLNLH